MIFGAIRSNPLVADLHAHGLFEQQYQKWLKLKSSLKDNIQPQVKYAGFSLPESLCLWDTCNSTALGGNFPYDQGDTSECVSYSICTMIEYHLYKTYQNAYELSKEYLYGWRSNYPEEGMEARDAIDMMLRYGVLPTSDFQQLKPIQEHIWTKTRMLLAGQELSDQQYQELDQEFKQIDQSTIVLSKSNTQRVNVQESNHVRARLNSVLDMKRALFYNGPCPIIVPVKDTEHSKGWIWDVEFIHRFRSYDDGLGHCMTLVGYDNQKQAFLVRNSWGQTWGPDGNGHVWMPYEHINDQKFWEAWTVFIDGKDHLQYIPDTKLLNNTCDVQQSPNSSVEAATKAGTSSFSLQNLISGVCCSINWVVE